MIVSKEIHITGLVQGVGFRPAIYRLAHEFNLKGNVANNNTGVVICIEGVEDDAVKFINSLEYKTPKASNITSVSVINKDFVGYDDFVISASSSTSNSITEVSPDIDVCNECLDDIQYQANRIDYCFTNCTNCGPRFSIIKQLPYDRCKTTMDVFPMCDLCKDEYVDINNRRFHAQPVACNNCGPHYNLYYNANNYTNIGEIIVIVSSLIDNGNVLAVKGIGGFHLLCNAFDEQSVIKLRKIKNRDGKPTAIMFSDIASAKKYLYINKAEEELLTSWRKPIVLLKIKKQISPSISNGIDTVGVMLPYMPFHYLLFKQLKTNSIVATSGNISDEPVIISNDNAKDVFADKCDAVLTYNREIHNRIDDSVAMVVGGVPRLIRRSRGYAPSPIMLNHNVEGIFAAGAELVVCFAIGKDNQVILSQHIGDIKNLETFDFYKESIRKFTSLFRFTPTLCVRDMHPDYLSSKFVNGLQSHHISVQHHHAHIASCMAENGIDEMVIGVCFDGTGYGDDGNTWGGEFFTCDLADYKRELHFEYIMQPGGDATTAYPWRMMLSYLMHYFGNDVVSDYNFLFKDIDEVELGIVKDMILKKINVPFTSSAGRLFDAVSALLGICRISKYHAEAPMMLESVAVVEIDKNYSYDVGDEISFKSTFEEIIKDIIAGTDVEIISAKFHNTIVKVVVDNVMEISAKTGITKVALSGGTFQNKLLLKRVPECLSDKKMLCFTQSKVPSNDGGLALGQMAIAAKRRKLGLI